MESIRILICDHVMEFILAFLFIVVLMAELLISKIQKIKIYHFKETIQNIAIGIFSFSIDMGLSLIVYPFWQWLYTYLHPFQNGQNTVWNFCLLFLLVDFMEYWFHRLSHQVHLLWTAHVVHHQARHFNLSVGFRTSFLIPVFNLLFYLLFPVLGFSPANLVIIILIQGAYQLLIHTRVAGKLGWLEYVFVTPAAHRVHHGKNELYLDKNYGKVFIIWDRLFKTYCTETETVEYGITDPKPHRDIRDVFFRQLRKMFSALHRNPEQWRQIIWGKPKA